MEIKRTETLICCLLGCIILAQGAWGQTIESPNAPGATARLEDAISVAGKYQNYVYGVIKKIEKHELILNKTRFGNNQVFKLDRKTKFVHNGKHSTLAKLKVGDMVWVDAKLKKKTEERIARKVITGVAPNTVLR